MCYLLFQVLSIQNKNIDPILMFKNIRGEIQTISTEQTKREICKWLSFLNFDKNCFQTVKCALNPYTFDVTNSNDI